MKLFIAFILLLGLLQTVVASEDHQEIEFQPIQVEGDYTQPRMTAAQQRKLLRKKLEKQNEMMVAKKIEQLRLKREMELNKQLQDIFNQQMKALNQLQ